MLRGVACLVTLALIAHACPVPPPSSQEGQVYTAAELRADSAQRIRVTRQNKTVAVRPGTDIALELSPSNAASTGYDWFVRSPGYLDFRACAFDPPTTNRIGAPGLDVFQFHVPSDCPTGRVWPIVFLNARPWNMDDGAEERVLQIDCVTD